MNERVCRQRNVFFLLPNIITVSRLILFLVSLVMLSIHSYPVFWFIILFFCDLGDALDGYLARKRNECTKIGQILDFTFDRIMVIGGMFLLCLFFPKYWFVFFLVAFLDVLAHYLYLKSVYELGETDHKKTVSSCPMILRWYYKSKTTIFLVCFFHDLFFGLLMLSHLIEINTLCKTILYFSASFAWLKTYIHINKIVFSLKSIAELETQK